jgi:hypothetical protein
MGRDWEKASVTGMHNGLWRGDAEYKYTARANNTANTFYETTGYTSLLPFDNGTALLLYTWV